MNNLETKILDLGSTIADELRATIVLVKIISAKNMIVQVFLENKDLSPISIETCSSFSKQLSVLLDVEEIMPDTRYKLEVSSLGINRPLLKMDDYLRFINYDVCITTNMVIEGLKSFKGKLISVSDTEVNVKLHEPHNEIHNITINVTNIHKANLDLVKDFVSGRKNGK